MNEMKRKFSCKFASAAMLVVVLCAFMPAKGSQAVPDKKPVLLENALQPNGLPVPMDLANRLIVIPDQATDQEHFAAKLLQDSLRKVSGLELPIVTESQKGSAAAISLGNVSSAEAISVEGLPPNAYRIAVKGNDWYFQGGTTRGPIDAVVAMLNEDLGCRWYSRFDPPCYPSLGTKLNIVPREYNPPFDLRTVYITEAWDADWIVMNHAQPIKQNPALPEAIGSGFYYPSSGVWFAHTFSRLAPSASLLAAKPELFAQINGVRQAGNLCLTNPETAGIVAENALYFLGKFPEARMIGVSQNDGDQVICQCDQCQALTKAEGSAAGPMLLFVNRVAEKIHAQRPDVKVSTLAYIETYAPPATIRPDKGVVIFLATDRHSWDNPYHTVEETGEFSTALKNWSAIAPEIHIWDYTFGDCRNWLKPVPNFDVVADDIRIYRNTPGVTGVFLQDDYCSIGSSRAVMKNWIFTQLLWNPDLDVQTLERDFTLGYYGASGPAMQEYNDLLRQEWRQYHDATRPDTVPFALTLDFLRKAEGILNRAREAAGKDERLQEKIRREQICLDYLRLTFKSKAFASQEDHLAAIDQLRAGCAELGITNLGEHQDLENTLRQWRMEVMLTEQLPSVPGAIVCGPDRAALSTMCGDANASLVEDQSFPAGVAIFQPCPQSSWSIQWSVKKELLTARRYALKFRLKASEIAKDGPAIRLGIYLYLQHKILMEKELPAHLLSDSEFAWLDAGTFELPPGQPVIVFAGAARNCAIKEFWVDRAELQPIPIAENKK